MIQQLEKTLGMSWSEIRLKNLDLDLIDAVHTLEDGGTDLSDEDAIKAWFTPELMSNYPERFVDAVMVRARAYIDEATLETKLSRSKTVRTAKYPKFRSDTIFSPTRSQIVLTSFRAII